MRNGELRLGDAGSLGGDHPDLPPPDVRSQMLNPPSAMPRNRLTQTSQRLPTVALAACIVSRPCPGCRLLCLGRVRLLYGLGIYSGHIDNQKLCQALRGKHTTEPSYYGLECHILMSCSAEHAQVRRRRAESDAGRDGRRLRRPVRCEAGQDVRLGHRLSPRRRLHVRALQRLRKPSPVLVKTGTAVPAEIKCQSQLCHSCRRHRHRVQSTPAVHRT